MLSRLVAAPTCWPVVASLSGSLVRALGPALYHGPAAHSSRWLATPAASADSPAQWRQRFDDIAPGSMLRLLLPDVHADLDVRVGEHEAIELNSTTQLEAQQSPHPSRTGAAQVTVTSSSSSRVAATPLQLTTLAPSRFLWVEASSGGGSVSVEVVQEGSLTVSTSGGDISVPKVKAVNAILASGGGAIRGGVTGVDVRLESGGGPVDLKTLVGKLAAVSTSCSGGGSRNGGSESRGGPLTIGACYAEELKLDSGGGDVHVTNMDCRNAVATLRSGGGAVAVDSLDGNLAIDSGGGSVRVQLADNAGSISISSGGGGVSLFLSPGLAGRLVVVGGKVSGTSAILCQGQQQPDGSTHFRLDPAAAFGSHARLGPHQQSLGELPGAAGWGGRHAPQSRMQRGGPVQHRPPGNAVTSASSGQAGADIVVDSGRDGTVSLEHRDWRDALRQRWS